VIPGAAGKPGTQLTLATTNEGEVATIRCTGRLVAGAAGSLQDEVRSLLPGPKRIVLDLADLSYMDSSGLGTIIGLHTSAKSAGARLELNNLNPRVRELFKITNVLSLFEVVT